MRVRTRSIPFVIVAISGGMLNGCADVEPPRGDEASPPAVSEALRPLIGEYLDGSDTMSILENDGGLVLLPWKGAAVLLESRTDGTFGTPGSAVVTVQTSEQGRTESISFGDRVFQRISLGAEAGGTFQITPVRNPEELRAEALAASPPVEDGAFRDSDLVELVSLDPTISLDVRYASTNNFMGEVFYSEPRAFLQRPAAEALERAHAWLGERGYGLLIHDGYRPWYVTKMFWDATPEDLKIFVANPESGSRHNRGCAVDLTLYDLATGLPIEMTGGYDEMSPRSFPDYPGGTTRQRWHRELLRQAMEAQNFAVYEAEWWHFDYQDWRSYRIGNDRFEDLGM
ncbi:MAG: M15 family metallopeptidase [Longimicrobiales bacterium]